MKFLVVAFALVFSAQTFATTSYTFNCKFVDDSCKFDEVRDMVEIDDGLFAGVEGNFELYYEPKSASMNIYLGDELKGLAIGASTLGVQNETKDGLVGIILSDDKAAIKGLKIARPALK